MQSKLDGTVYSLETGGVLEWCPKDTLLRKILGRLAMGMRHGTQRSHIRWWRREAHHYALQAP